jgi:UDP-N-acetylmuramyl pentapeptide phosphotransferase/UDP-N-acetylglucosamine-1-phosphate transferase
MKNLYDEPNGRSSHKYNTPTLGGVAIFAGTLLSFTLFSELTLVWEMPYIIAGIIIVFFIGLKDDIIMISAKWKLLGQLITAVILSCMADIRITNIYGFLGIDEIGYIPSILLTIFVMVVVMNGFNLIDGIDGLAAGVGIVTSLSFGLMFYLEKQYPYALLAAGLMGSLISFFWFNVFGLRKKIFMGDSGSLIIGLMQAILVIKILGYEKGTAMSFYYGATPAIAIAILIVPLYDTFRVFTLRILRGQSPFVADKMHVHHRLLKLGLSHIQATGAILVANILIIAIAFLLQSLGVLKLTVVLLILATLFSLLPYFFNRHRKRKELETLPD